MKNNNLRKLCECAVLVALAFVLSLVKIPLSFGGSVTAGCMVPLVIASYRNGVKWGLGTAFVFSIIKMIMGFENFSYVTGVASILAVLFFDYLLAYTAVGLAGIFAPKKEYSNGKITAFAAIGAVFGMIIRYICHVVSGAVVWYDLTKVWEESDPTNMVFRYGKWMYSVVYNGIYMLPETIITAVLSVIVTLIVLKGFAKKN